MKALFNSVKKVIALALTLIFCFLSVMGKIDAKDYMTVFLMVISFYFGQSSVRETIKENK